MKRIIFLLMLIMLSSSVYGDIHETLLHYYKFDTNTGQQDDEVGTNDLTKVAATFRTIGKINGDFYYDSSKYMYGDTLNNELYGNTSLSINLWANITDVDDLVVMTTSRDASKAHYVMFYHPTAHYVACEMEGYSCQWAGDPTQDAYHMITCVKNATHINLYIDGLLNQSCANASTFSNITDSILRVGRNYDYAPQDFDGDIDELGIWSTALNSSDISLLYNGGNGFPYPFIDNLTIDFFNRTPVNNTNISQSSLPYTLEFNFSPSGSQAIDCILYEDGVPVNTTTFCPVCEDHIISRTWDNDINYTSFEYNLTCNNSASSDSDWVKTINVLLDNASPQIIYSYPNDDNSTTFTELLDVNISFSDDNLFNVSVNIYYPDMSSLDNYTNESLTVIQIDFNETYNLSAQPLGNYTIEAKACDGHTARSIPEWSNRKSADTLYFDNDRISISSVSSDINLISVDTSKSLDRYDFQFRYQKGIESGMKSYTFRVESEDSITYLPDSGYAAHFITGSKWIDFELSRGTASYYVRKVSDTAYMVDIETTEEELIFKSIGELNCRNMTVLAELINPLGSVNLSLEPSTGNINDTYNVTWNYTDDNPNICNMTLYAPNMTIIHSNTSFSGFYEDNASVNGTYYAELNCSDIYNNTFNASGSITIYSSLGNTSGTLEYGVCPDNIQGMMGLGIMAFFCLGLCFIGFNFRAYILTFLSGLAVTFLGVVFIACYYSFGLIIIVIGVAMMLLSVFKLREGF